MLRVLQSWHMSTRVCSWRSWGGSCVSKRLLSCRELMDWKVAGIRRTGGDCRYMRRRRLACYDSLGISRAARLGASAGAIKWLRITRHSVKRIFFTRIFRITLFRLTAFRMIRESGARKQDSSHMHDDVGQACEAFGTLGLVDWYGAHAWDHLQNYN